MLHKINENKKCTPELIFFRESFFRKDSDDFWRWKLTLKIRFWHFLTAIFGHLKSLMKKSNPFLWSVQSYLQSEMFLSNSVNMMKNLHMWWSNRTGLICKFRDKTIKKKPPWILPEKWKGAYSVLINNSGSRNLILTFQFELLWWNHSIWMQCW